MSVSYRLLQDLRNICHVVRCNCEQVNKLCVEFYCVWIQKNKFIKRVINLRMDWGINGSFFSVVLNIWYEIFSVLFCRLVSPLPLLLYAGLSKWPCCTSALAICTECKRFSSYSDLSEE